jgi:hypothetical protein
LLTKELLRFARNDRVPHSRCTDLIGERSNDRGTVLLLPHY